MKPETILNAYTVAVKYEAEERTAAEYLDDDGWQAAAAVRREVGAAYLAQAAVFKRRLLRLLVTEAELGDYEAVFGRRKS